jgi:transposase-like protein
MIKGIYYRWSKEEKNQKIEQFLRIKKLSSSIPLTLREFAQSISVSESTFRTWLVEYRKKQI